MMENAVTVTTFMSYGMFLMALSTAVALAFLDSPYGKHFDRKYGRPVNSRWSWFIQELPSITCFLYFVLNSHFYYNWTICGLVFMFCIHYVQR